MMYAKRWQVRVPRVHKRPQTAPYINRGANEQWLEDRIGAHDLEQAVNISAEMHVPLPVAGTGAYLYKGQIIAPHATGFGQASGREAPVRSLFDGLAGTLNHIYRSSVRDAVLALAREERGGFASLSDLISEATTGGKKQTLHYFKAGSTAVSGRSSTLWYATGQPGTGATAAALAGGTDHTSATTGAIRQVDAAGGDTLHLIGAEGAMNVASVGLLLYDRIWAGEPSATTTTAQTVTMTPTRYATTGASGTSKGNQVFAEVRSTMDAATPAITMQYVDDSGNAAENATAVTGITGCVAPTFGYGSATLPNLFIPLNAGDVGVSDITQWTNTPSWVSGAYAIVLGHPLMYIPGLAVANAGFIRDGINSAFSMERIYDSACLALIEPSRNSTTATNSLGLITVVSG